jgi:membrane protease YdiL (CAAX protease family)
MDRLPPGVRRFLPFSPYLLAIVAAEGVARGGSVVLAGSIDAVVIVVGLNRVANAGHGRALLAGLSLIALLRLLSFAASAPPGVDQVRYLGVALAGLLALWLAARLLGLGRRDLGLVGGSTVVAWSVLAIPPGLALGFIDYWLVQPFPWVEKLALPEVLTSVAVLALATGLTEELLFRGLVQRAASDLFGARIAIPVVALLSAILAVTSWSVAGLALGIGAAMYFAILTDTTRSIVPAAAAHASLNVALFLIAPFLDSGRVPA